MLKSIKTEDLNREISTLLVQNGVDAGDAEVVAHHLLDAEANGYRSHGISRLRGILGLGEALSRWSVPKISAVAPSVLKYNANGQLGIAALHQAALAVAESVDGSGIVLAGVTGYIGTTGELGSYTRLLASKGFVGLALCGSEYAVAPYGGARAILGTNPIAVAFPTQKFDFSADVATAAWSYGKIKNAELQGSSVPEGVVQGAAGEISSDPADADNGSQLPMAGHKGYALGLAIELLCGPLLGAKAGRDAVSGGDGAIIIGIRADVFRDRDEVYGDAESLFDEITNSPRVSESIPIRIPGGLRLKELPGDITVDDKILIDLGLDIG
ncbi:Ldh family oxidoreductase [Subtercola lobariae]|uniref:Sulfolactate dehydrogenase n=1 Tax=Subtercola lobariae TaxID=1588641 RepID=A0A917B289_9MICO|nr:Ldh family oxidoreductase [Subtercola lobariae]GGF18516.1 sulfolactate dehydrogenase [Subtercola lobariae]